MSDLAEAEISFGDAKITIRGPQSFVQAEVTRLAAMARAHAGQPTPLAAATDSHVATDERGLAGATSERDFVALKNPKGHPETASVLGFWLTAHGAAEFSEDDVRRAYVRAGVRPPKVVSQALRDAKRFLDSIEQGSKRGMYRLTTHGDRIVRFDLPRK
jgi:hypothetical protein